MHKIGNLAAGTPVFRPARWTTAAANDDYSPDTFPSTLFRTSTTKRFRVVHPQLTTFPFSLTMVTKAATTAAVVRPPRHAVNSETCKLNWLHYTNSQDFTRIYSSLGLGRGTFVVVHRRASMLTLVGWYRDRRSAAGIPQAPLGGRAHRRSTQCPTDDHRHSALPLRAEEQGHRRRGREDPA